MGTCERFTAFLKEIALTPDQRRDGQANAGGVIRCLNAHYYGLNSSTANGFLVGSWGKDTEVRPPRDVDVQFVLPYSVYARYVVKPGNRQSALLQEVKNVLLGCYSRTTMRADGQVVMVPFSSYAVEVVPCFASGSQYMICDTNNGGTFKTVDPKSEIFNVDYYDRQSNGNVRDLIRMMKRWQWLCNVPLKSFLIELLSVNFINQWPEKGKGPTYYDWMSRDFLKYLASSDNTSVLVPGTNELINIGDAWLSRAVSAWNHAIKACQNESSNPGLAVDEWRQVFGHDMPK